MSDKAYVKELEKTVEQLQKQLLETQNKLEKYESPPYTNTIDVTDVDASSLTFTDYLNSSVHPEDMG